MNQVFSLHSAIERTQYGWHNDNEHSNDDDDTPKYFPFSMIFTIDHVITFIRVAEKKLINFDRFTMNGNTFGDVF